MKGWRMEEMADLDELLEGLGGIGGILDQPVEPGDVPGVVLAVVEVNGLGGDVGGESILGPGKSRQGDGHRCWVGKGK